MFILLRFFICSRAALVAENLFLRKQLALFQERRIRPRRRTTPALRLILVLLAQYFPWRGALVVVKPATFIQWHRTAFRRFWPWKSRRPKGRPPLPANLGELIGSLHRANPSWGEDRIANELSLKLGLKVSPATVRKYLDRFNRPRSRKTAGQQRWSAFVRNHASAIVACDFLTVVTVHFRVLYVFVAMEIASRRILHCNVTAHSTADWTLHQFREFLAFDHPYRLVLHDRDAIFSPSLDAALHKDFSLRVLKTPVRMPTANAFCERLIGTIRRECLDYLIPFGERHLRAILQKWIGRYNRGRPHSSLGPGIPEPPQAQVPASVHRHKLPKGYRVTATPILGGLHHEYGLEKEAA